MLNTRKGERSPGGCISHLLVFFHIPKLNLALNRNAKGEIKIKIRSKIKRGTQNLECTLWDML